MVDIHQLASAAAQLAITAATPLSDDDDGLIAGIIEAAPDGIVMIDESGTIVLVNRRTEELFGYDRADLLGKPVESLLPERYRQVHQGHRTRYRVEPRTRPMGVGLSLLGQRSDGTEFPIEISLSALDSGGAHRAIAMIRDITERLEIERLLGEAAESVQLLEDRERIARDLHDLVIQRLFAAGMALQGTISRLDDQDVAQRVTRVVDDLDDTISQLRTVIFGLQDRRDARSSIRSSVIQIVSEERAALGFEPRIRFDGPVDSIGNAFAEHLLAVLREALSNVARHAQATAVDIHLAADPQALTLRITDNGIGIANVRRGGNGLRNASDRAIALGGTCLVTSSPTGGTIFEWRVVLS
jgi:two-component system, NarL family, sensor histidine kinase DevS